MAASVDIGTLITRRPDLRGGRPIIAGTGMCVRTIAVWHNMGETPEQIAADYPHLTLAQVLAALAYYHANKAEIDEDLDADERFEAEFLRQHPPSR
jgi:uncharacterized protein (DUF433 family)